MAMPRPAAAFALFGRQMRGLRRSVERLGRGTILALDEVGFAAALLAESFYWLAVGRRQRQPVRVAEVFRQAWEIGLQAVPILSVASFTIGVMLSIQGVYSLRYFGAESRVATGIALSVVREFSSLMTGILVAGRSGSALAARLGTMKINQEIDALVVMGLNPVRLLVVPPLLAMTVMVPALTVWSHLMALLGGGLYISADLGMSLGAVFQSFIEALKLGDLGHGLAKSAIFAVLIALIGVVNGALVSGGAEGVGRMTTRSVVHAISAIVFTDMLFVFMVTR